MYVCMYVTFFHDTVNHSFMKWYAISILKSSVENIMYVYLLVYQTNGTEKKNAN